MFLFCQWMFMGVPLWYWWRCPLPQLIIVKVCGVTELGVEEIQQFVKRFGCSQNNGFQRGKVCNSAHAGDVSSLAPKFMVPRVLILRWLFWQVLPYYFCPATKFCPGTNLSQVWAGRAFSCWAALLPLATLLLPTGWPDGSSPALFPGAINLPLVGITFAVAIIVFLMLIVVPVAPTLIPAGGSSCRPGHKYEFDACFACYFDTGTGCL